MNSKRWNELIDAANNDIPFDKVMPPIANDEERETYSNLLKELARYREIDSEFKFSPVELDWEDVPDIYND